MISIKDYAKEHNITYEAVRKQIKRYQKELDGHISKINRTKFLDDFAVEFLNEKRKNNPVVIIEANKDERIQQLSEENKALLLKIADLQEQLLKEKDNVKLLQEEKIRLLERSHEEKKSIFFKFFKKNQ